MRRQDKVPNIPYVTYNLGDRNIKNRGMHTHVHTYCTFVHKIVLKFKVKY